MAKFIEVTVNEKPYRLMFNRRSVQKMEEKGFNIQETANKPATTYEQLVRGALYANHPFLEKGVFEMIADALDAEYGMDKTLEALATLYGEVFQSGEEKKKLEIKTL